MGVCPAVSTVAVLNMLNSPLIEMRTNHCMQHLVDACNRCNAFVAELAQECASSYHRYGEALFYKAQEESDVFGAPIQQAAIDKESDEQAAEEADNRDAEST